MCPAVRRPPKRWSTAFSSCRRRSAAPGPSSGEGGAMTWPAQDVELTALGEAARAACGEAVSEARVDFGELTLLAAADRIVEVLTVLRDEPRFAFQQLIDLC